MMSLWDALRMNMMISYQELVRTFPNSCAFKAASDLIFLGVKQPNGYTEPLLHAWRLREKESH